MIPLTKIIKKETRMVVARNWVWGTRSCFSGHRVSVLQNKEFWRLATQHLECL
jgi:hypothetical protein